MIMKVFLDVTGWLPDLFEAQPSKSCLSPYAGLFCPGPWAQQTLLEIQLGYFWMQVMIPQLNCFRQGISASPVTGVASCAHPASSSHLLCLGNLSPSTLIRQGGKLLRLHTEVLGPKKLAVSSRT